MIHGLREVIGQGRAPSAPEMPDFASITILSAATNPCAIKGASCRIAAVGNIQAKPRVGPVRWQTGEVPAGHTASFDELGLRMCSLVPGFIRGGIFEPEVGTQIDDTFAGFHAGCYGTHGFRVGSARNRTSARSARASGANASNESFTTPCR